MYYDKIIDIMYYSCVRSFICSYVGLIYFMYFRDDIMYFRADIIVRAVNKQ